MALNSVSRHVAKTGDIKDLVITEESGIAKGIRRITAVTGHEAHEVTRVAQALKAKLDSLELASGKEKDAGLKALSVVRVLSTFTGLKFTERPQELGQADISVIRKTELRDRLATIRKAFDKQAKEKEAATNKEVRVYRSSL